MGYFEYWCYYPATARYLVFFRIRHFSVSINIALVALVVCTLYHHYHYHDHHQGCHIYLYHNARNELFMARPQTRSKDTSTGDTSPSPPRIYCLPKTKAKVREDSSRQNKHTVCCHCALHSFETKNIVYIWDSCCLKSGPPA